MRGNSLSRQQIFEELQAMKDVSFNHFIKLLREAFISRAEWLNVVGMSRTAVESYEMKDRLPDIDYIAKLSMFTGYDLSDLIRRRIYAGGAHNSVLGWVNQSLPSHPNGQHNILDFEPYEEIKNSNNLLGVTGNWSIGKSRCAIKNFSGNLTDGLFLFDTSNAAVVKQVRERVDGNFVISDKDSAELYTPKEANELDVLGQVTDLHFKIKSQGTA